jgi:hypothetical protein
MDFKVMPFGVGWHFGILGLYQTLDYGLQHLSGLSRGAYDVDYKAVRFGVLQRLGV